MQTGVAKELPFGFSTKYTDRETGLVMYQLRPYNPATGRFIQHDPIEEQGGINLYGMVNNDAINHWDYLGLAKEYKCCTSTQIRAIKRAESISWGTVMKALTIIESSYTEGDIYLNYPNIAARIGTKGMGGSLIIRSWRSDLLLNLRKISQGYSDNDYNVECMQKDNGAADGQGSYAQAPAHKLGQIFRNSIRVFPIFFTGNGTQQAKAILHESSHLFAQTTDNFSGTTWAQFPRTANDAYS